MLATKLGQGAGRAIMKRMAVLLAALSVAAPGFTTPSPESPPERLLWVVRWDDAVCSLIRRRTGDRPVSFGISLSPTARMMFVQLNFEGPPLESGGLEVKVELFFSPGEAPEPLVFHVGRDGNRNNLMSFADMSFLDRLARARSIRFGDSHVYPTIDLGDAAKAVAGLRACRDGILRDWGVDSAALDALRRPPELEMPPSLRLAW